MCVICKRTAVLFHNLYVCSSCEILQYVVFKLFLCMFSCFFLASCLYLRFEYVLVNYSCIQNTFRTWSSHEVNKSGVVLTLSSSGSRVYGSSVFNTSEIVLNLCSALFLVSVGAMNLSKSECSKVNNYSITRTLTKCRIVAAHLCGFES